METINIPDDAAAACAMFHDITNRVIMPAKEKGVAHAMAAAARFIDLQSRNVPSAGTQQALHHRVAFVCGDNCLHVPLRPTAGVSSAPVLCCDSSTGGSGNLSTK